MTEYQMMLTTIFVPIILLFLCLSVFMMLGIGSFLIAGFNTLSKEEKTRYKEKELTRYAGKIMMINSILLVLLYFALYFELYWSVVSYLVLVIGSCIYAIVKANSKHFKRDS